MNLHELKQTTLYTPFLQLAMHTLFSIICTLSLPHVCYCEQSQEIGSLLTVS